MSDGEGGQASAGGDGAGGARVTVPCLHNPTRHELDFHLTGGDFAWIDLEGPTDEDLEQVARHIDLHPLTLTDAKTFGQRPKIEDYDHYVYMVVSGVDPGTASGQPMLREIHMILSQTIVLTIHRRPHTPLNQVRERYGRQPVRSRLFLVYSLLDAVISTFEPVLSRIDDDIDEIEERVIDAPREQELRRIFSIKRDLVAMRRVISPMRDMFQRREDHLATLAGPGSDDMLYFRDLYDELIRISETVDAYRDLLSSATDLYLSTVANRQGEVNRQLTIVATIFLPLTFITGFFGQNFAFLTGHVQNTVLGFWLLGIGLLAVSILGFWVWFRRRGWVGRDATGGDPDAARSPSRPAVGHDG